MGISFGIRNTKNINNALSEAYRVLKPGGRFLCLEFSKIENSNLDFFYKNYSKLIPLIGKVIVGEKEPYEYLIKRNVRSALLVCNEVIPLMLNNKGENIIITSSIGGEKGFALESLYCMTKGAVLQLARSIAVEYRDQGIRCNAICPGFVKTNHGLREIKELDEQGQNWNENDLHSVQGRICKPEEVASAVLYLASDESSFVNGAALYVDNGWYAKG